MELHSSDSELLILIKITAQQQQRTHTTAVAAVSNALPAEIVRVFVLVYNRNLESATKCLTKKRKNEP